jgi:trimethylamine--corrinoid protein Co-methyltransferase
MTPDGLIFEQTLFQKASNMVMQCLAGGKLIIGAGVIDTCMAASPVQLVIDDEIMGIARRLSQGIKVNEDTLAVDAIDRVGPRGHFLSDLHTLQHLRTGELIRTEIFDRDLRDIWVSKGAKGLEQKAREKALAILDKHEVEPLPEDVVEELKSIVGKADQQLAET